MKALQAVGIQKAVRFIVWELFGKLLHWCIVPQLRSFLLRLAGAEIGADTVILDVNFVNAYHHGFKKLSIGREVFIGEQVALDLRGGITLEDTVTISNGTNIATHINVGFPDHPLQSVYPTQESRVIIKRGSYIGTGAIILSGVTVGEGSVVGAGAVVTKNVPAHRLVVGVPAKVKKKI